MDILEGRRVIGGNKNDDQEEVGLTEESQMMLTPCSSLTSSPMTILYHHNYTAVNGCFCKTPVSISTSIFIKYSYNFISVSV